MIEATNENCVFAAPIRAGAKVFVETLTFAQPMKRQKKPFQIHNPEGLKREILK